MFKEAQLVEGKQDIYGRKVFVVSPREDLILHLIEKDPRIEAFKEALYRPTVYLTPEVPYEESLEGRSPSLQRIIRRKFVEDYLAVDCSDIQAVQLEYREGHTDEQVKAEFDRWWTVREAEDYLEFEEGSWLK